MKEYKINMDRTDPTPEEIAKSKDFSKVLRNYSAAAGPIYTKTWFLSTVLLVAAGGILILVNLIKTFTGPDQDQGQSYVYMPAGPGLIETTPFINPPVNGLDIEYETYAVPVNERSGLRYHTGTRMYIPRNAFMDAAGKDVEGHVDIKYREFHDAADFFVSGIPMDYDSAGVEYHFESAGMIEMLAFRDGKPVFLKPNKEIRIEMTSEYSGTHYNLYDLDTVSRKWNYRGKDQVIAGEGIDRQVNAWKEIADTDTLGQDHSFDNKPPATIEPEQEPEVRKLEEELKIIRQDIAQIEKGHPAEPQRVSSERYNFDIAVDPEEFPEIAVYKDARFEIGAENKNFTSAMYDVEWEDALLEQKEAGVNYNLTLSKGASKYTWVVYPVYEGDDYVKAKKVFDDKFEKYTEKLMRRRADEKKAADIYAARLAEFEKKRLEQLKRWEEQKRQYEEAQKMQEQHWNTQLRVTRAFNITRFGTTNCDSPVRAPRGKTVAAKFEDGDGNPLHFTIIYLVQKNRNSLYPFDSGQFGKLTYNPNEKNVLWGVTSDNHLALFNTDRFSEIPGNSREFTFKMDVIPDEMLSVADVRKAIAMK